MMSLNSNGNLIGTVRGYPCTYNVNINYEQYDLSPLPLIHPNIDLAEDKDITSQSSKFTQKQTPNTVTILQILWEFSTWWLF